ncbi:hypothetical protein BC829DRAFT_239296 [Chytridium lagenaria]|nr:hypothetical protein BC829DRAFT_239296 [Chytridium lagenaria]
MKVHSFATDPDVIVLPLQPLKPLEVRAMADFYPIYRQLPEDLTASILEGSKEPLVHPSLGRYCKHYDTVRSPSTPSAMVRDMPVLEDDEGPAIPLSPVSTATRGSGGGTVEEAVRKALTLSWNPRIGSFCSNLWKLKNLCRWCQYLDLSWMLRPCFTCSNAMRLWGLWISLQRFFAISLKSASSLSRPHQMAPSHPMNRGVQTATHLTTSHSPNPPHRTLITDSPPFLTYPGTIRFGYDGIMNRR